MKKCFSKNHLLNLFFILVTGLQFSQQSSIETSILTDFTNALQLYQNKAYTAAQKSFEKVVKNSQENSNLKADAAYFEAMCALKLQQTSADQKILDFVATYPNSTKKNQAFFNVGNYYFANKKPAYALKWYQKVNKEVLSEENRKELNFKSGYSLLVSGDLSAAKNLFLPLINDGKYGNDARYYYGFIAYKLEDYGIAESTLKEIADNESYKAEISYYLLDISFKSGKFERCIKVGEELLKDKKRNDVSDISKIVGESYFNLGKYAESIPFLKNYKGNRGKWNNTDFYQLGYAYYKQNDFENAIANFNKIIDQKNAVSQNAYYHLAECYLNTEKKNEALNAFKTASEMDFNQKIKEDAALNYAKLSYEEGNPFENVADVLQNYLKNYPNSTSYKEINQLVVYSFIHQQDYEGALNYLKKKKSDDNTALTLEVSLYRGIQLFTDKKYAEALPYFTISKKSLAPEIFQKGYYWEAETLFRLNKFEEALTKFLSTATLEKTSKTTELQLVDYNVGYCYFKLNKYTEAIRSFKIVLQKKELDNTIKQDATLRLADSYFAISNFGDAIKSYQLVVNETGIGADYAQYQIGMSYGFRGENLQKIDALKKVVNNFENSNLKDDALFQLANTFTTLKNAKEAHEAYDRLQKNYPKSAFIPRALVRQGLLYYNGNENAKALEKFKLTASKFPNSPDALEAVNNAKNIYIDEDKLDDFVAWTKTLRFVNVSETELEKSAFTIAERKYFDDTNNQNTILSLTKYLKNYPDGANDLKANYYLASTYFKEKEFDNAIPYFEKVIKAGQSNFSEDALAKLAEIQLSKENYDVAIPLLERLEQEAYATENAAFAQSNLMKAYFSKEAFEKSLTFAKKVLSKESISPALELDAKTIIARASFKLNDFETAKEYYKTIENKVTGELKAEILYHEAYFQNQEKAFEKSNEIVKKLIAEFASYKYWGVKSYVIMGKNYYGLKDAYQATFILENVIKNFPQFEDIVREAKTELIKIKDAESKTNNSINPQIKN
ncbi:tetratricopeptide repeat protein [Polaribacter sp.]|uniref:tetratricopeptide repeat protein n=1 Tax=Polaribacter sp. TaxID=1920175 RepID=UPI0040478BF3